MSYWCARSNERGCMVTGPACSDIDAARYRGEKCAVGALAVSPVMPAALTTSCCTSHLCANTSASAEGRGCSRCSHGLRPGALGLDRREECVDCVEHVVDLLLGLAAPLPPRRLGVNEPRRLSTQQRHLKVASAPGVAVRHHLHRAAEAILDFELERRIVPVVPSPTGRARAQRTASEGIVQAGRLRRGDCRIPAVLNLDHRRRRSLCTTWAGVGHLDARR